ncbi:MAG: hypothetical protein IJY54_05865 [Paludibacteraceae bacterium]|nr:hypothetical protein [Paludibacteraceae bacterium]
MSKVVSSVYIYGKNGNIYRNPSPVLSTTLHELSHIAHCSSVGFLKFTQTEDHIKEAYTTAVQWDMTIKEYYDLYLKEHTALSDLLNFITSQKWPLHNRNNKYSPLFIDMIDDFNQKNLFSDYFYIPVDNVDGYTLEMIDTNLTTIRNYDNVESFMLNNKPSGVTINQINEFLKMYKEKWTEK